MSWQSTNPWPQGTTLTGIVGAPAIHSTVLPAVVNPTPGVLPPQAAAAPPAAAMPAAMPAGMQYSPEQWAQMQQQNWQQWAQWQQQYQQWHQQYGAEYQKSMNAMQTPTTAPNTSIPPPPPNENKPPPPPPPEEAKNQQYSRPPPTGGYTTGPPPSHQQYNQGGGNWQNASGPGKRSSFDNEQYGTNKRQMLDNRGGNSSWQAQPPPNQATNAAAPPPAQQKTSNLEELSEAEKKFDKEFAAWEAQFNKWKEQNANHPDKSQYIEYEKKWESWRNSLLERREQMRKKRVALQATLNVPKLPVTGAPPPLIASRPHQPGFPQSDYSRSAAQPPAAVQPENFFNKPPPTQNNEPLAFKPPAKAYSSNNVVEDIDATGGDDFLKSSSPTPGGIPGLDLVKDGEAGYHGDDNNPDECEITEESSQPQTHLPSKGPDLDAISKGINSILGDPKLLNMLSMVSQNQTVAPPINTQPNLLQVPPGPPPIQNRGQPNIPSLLNMPMSRPNLQDKQRQSFDRPDFDEYSEHSYKSGQMEAVNNFDDQTRMSFNNGPNDQDMMSFGNNARGDRNDSFRRFQDNNNRNGGFGGNDHWRNNSFGGPNDSPNNFRNANGPSGFNNRDNNAPFNRDNDEPFNRNNFNRDDRPFNRQNSGPFNRDNDGPFDRNNRGQFNRDDGPFNRQNSGPFNRDNNDRSFDRNDRFNRDDRPFNRNNRDEGPFNRNNQNEGPFNRNNRNEGPFNRNQGQFNRNNSFNQEDNYGDSYGEMSNERFNDGEQYGEEEQYREEEDFDKYHDLYAEDQQQQAQGGGQQEVNQVPEEPVPEQPEPEPVDEGPLFVPEVVVDYEHKSLKEPEPEIALDMLRMFDYRHKPVNRIPYPQRPIWLSSCLRNIKQFDPLGTTRFAGNDLSYDRDSARYPEFEHPSRFIEREPKYATELPRNRYDKDLPPAVDRFSGNNRHPDPTDRGDYDRNRGRHDNEFSRNRGRDDNDFSRNRGRDDNEFSRNRGRDDFDTKNRGRPGNFDRRGGRGGGGFDRERRSNYSDDRDAQKLELEELSDDEDFGDAKTMNTSKVALRFSPPPKESNQGQDAPVSFSNPVKPSVTPVNKKPIVQSVTMEDLICSPGRHSRPQRMVIILRGPPGSGKTHLAKLIKDKEVENGGSAPRILSLDDYFMVEHEKEIIEDGKRLKVKEMTYEYEAEMEESYRQSLIKSFKKTVTDGYFSFVIVDNVNQKVKNFGEMWSFAKQNGFQVYICQMDLDPELCTSRNVHQRPESFIEDCIAGWEPTPAHHPLVDATGFLQSQSITEVEMELENEEPEEIQEEEEPDSMASTNPSGPPRRWQNTSSWTTSGRNRPNPQNQDRRGFDGPIWRNRNNRRR